MKYKNLKVICKDNKSHTLNFYLVFKEKEIYLFTTKYYSKSILKAYANGKFLRDVYTPPLSVNNISDNALSVQSSILLWKTRWTLAANTQNSTAIHIIIPNTTTETTAMIILTKEAIVMQTLKKTNSGIQSLNLDSVLLDKRMIFLDTEITPESANLILKQFLFLESADPYEPIKLIINSNGGQVTAGLMIYDVIQACSCDVDIYCTGMTASMAAVLLASGKKGHRFILPHSEVMIHEPLIANGFGGSATTIEKTTQNILKVKAQINQLLAKHTGNSVKEIDRATAFDNYMTATEAVQFGLCDKIVDRVL